ncbi:MAG TPA: phosphatidylglycerophosphatase A [Vicinamibacterales bacterium]|nr:phosphatidylglycerophosphatase A [Vicinamibacterales bacterium]
MTRLAVLLATSGGAGYMPVAPGTAGSAVGVLAFLLVDNWDLGSLTALIAVVTVVGVWASGRAARHFGREDPGPVVIDEVAGQLVTFAGTGVGLMGVLAGFVIFRVFDIIKPWPAGRLEALPGGVGIMADDLMAGLYANLTLLVLLRLFPGTF